MSCCSYCTRTVRGWCGGVDDPADRRIELDVCLPPERTAEGWRYVDLELDPVRHEQEHWIEIQDEDEYQDSVRQGLMTPAEADLARRSADEGARLLLRPDQPWWSHGWRMLSVITRQPPPSRTDPTRPTGNSGR